MLSADLYEELWQNIKNWMREESPFLSNFLYSLWKRGKVAFIIFLAGNTRWNKNVFRAFVVWEGAKAGFFMTIFCHSMGVRGFFSCVAMGIPHPVLDILPQFLIQICCRIVTQKIKNTSTKKTGQKKQNCLSFPVFYKFKQRHTPPPFACPL